MSGGCAVLRHGFTMKDLDAASRIAVSRSKHMGGDRGDLYQTAWDGALDVLLDDTQTPNFQDLVHGSTRALWELVNDARSNYGYSTSGWGRGKSPGFSKYWHHSPTWTSTVEDTVVDRIAAEQILSVLDGRFGRALAVRAATRDNTEAACLMRQNQQYTRRLLNQARSAFIALWLEHETPVGRREYMRRVRTPDGNQPCGTVAAYNRHVRRKEQPCMDCRAAWAAYQRERMARRKT